MRQLIRQPDRIPHQKVQTLASCEVIVDRHVQSDFAVNRLMVTRDLADIQTATGMLNGVITAISDKADWLDRTGT
jgi:hypothetical protein